MAVLWSWPCHAVNAPVSDDIHADFPGRVRDRIREYYGLPDLPVLYFPGFAGDLRADHTSMPTTITAHIDRPLARRFSPMNSAEFDTFCDPLCRAMQARLDGLDRWSPIGSSFNVASAEVPLAQIIDGAVNPNTSLVARVLNVGDTACVLLNAEVCSPYYDLLAPLLPPGAFVSGYLDEAFGYLPVDHQIKLGGYEVAGFFEAFGLSGRYKDYVQHVVQGLVESAVNTHGNA